MFTDYNSIFILIICYFIGSIPFGLLISKITKKNDPRLFGSKNIGATNMLRIGGWKIGLITLVFDITKGFIPIKLLLIFNQQEIIVFAIFGVIFGHLYPVWLKFRGGKGVAALIGILLGYDLFLFLCFSITWILVSILFKYSSLSSSLATFGIFIYEYFFLENNILSFLFISFIIILYAHRSNILKLINKTETKVF